MPFDPKRMIYHDYGGQPENKEGVFNPYHTLVFPDGGVRYRNPDDPYGAPAPHAFMLNKDSLGLSYAGNVGAEPTPEGMRALQGEYEKIQSRFPGMEGMGHGEAFQRYLNKGDIARPSRDGRELQEASWRDRVTDLSQVPESGLAPLHLLSPDAHPAAPAPAAPYRSPFAATAERAAPERIAQAAVTPPSPAPAAVGPAKKPPFEALPFKPAGAGDDGVAKAHAEAQKTALDWYGRRKRGATGLSSLNDQLFGAA